MKKLIILAMVLTLIVTLDRETESQQATISSGKTSLSETMDISLGTASGLAHVHKFGHNPDIDSAPEDIWEGGGMYQWAATGSAWCVGDKH